MHTRNEVDRRQSWSYWLSIAALGLAGCAGLKVDVAAETDALRARSRAVAAAEGAKDVDGALAFYAEDASVQMPGAPQIEGRKAITDAYRAFFTGAQVKEFEGTTSQITMAQSGDLAFETGVNRTVFPGSQGDLLDMGKYVVVWKKTNGNWYIALLALSSDTPAPVPVKPATP